MIKLNGTKDANDSLPDEYRKLLYQKKHKSFLKKPSIIFCKFSQKQFRVGNQGRSGNHKYTHTHTHTYIHTYIYIYIYNIYVIYNIYIYIYTINLQAAAVSLFKSLSVVQLRSNEDLEGAECSNYC